MVFHPTFHVGAIFALLLSIAFVGNVGGPLSSPFLLVAADELQCEMALEFSTWYNKTLPPNEIPVPDAELLQHGIRNILSERFDIHAGTDNWVTKSAFEFYELKNAKVDPDIESSSLSSSLEDPSNRRSLRHQKGKPDQIGDTLPCGLPVKCIKDFQCRMEFYEKKVSAYRNQAEVHVPYCRLCENDDDTDPKASKIWRQKQEEKYDVERKKAANRFCRLCVNDDDETNEVKQYFKRKAQIRREKYGFIDPPGKFYGGRKLTIDHVIQGYTQGGNNVTLDNSYSLHQDFEKDVCNELRKLNETFPTIESAEDCKISLHCRNADDDYDENEEELVADDFYYHENDEWDYELIVFDNRDAETTNKKLESPFAKWWTKNNHQQQQDDEAALPLYVVTVN